MGRAPARRIDLARGWCPSGYGRRVRLGATTTMVRLIPATPDSSTYQILLNPERKIGRYRTAVSSLPYQIVPSCAGCGRGDSRLSRLSMMEPHTNHRMAQSLLLLPRCADCIHLADPCLVVKSITDTVTLHLVRTNTCPQISSFSATWSFRHIVAATNCHCLAAYVRVVVANRHHPYTACICGTFQ